MNSYVKSYSDQAIEVSDIIVQVIDDITRFPIKMAQVILCEGGKETAQYTDENGEAAMRFIPVNSMFNFKIKALGYINGISAYQTNNGYLSRYLQIPLVPSNSPPLAFVSRPGGRISHVSTRTPAYDPDDLEREKTDA